MATAKTVYYAWTDIKGGTADEPKTFAAGSAVSESDFSEEDWAQLLDSRSVRTREYPNMPADWQGSPREFMVKQVTEQLEAAEDMLSDDDVLAAEQTADMEDTE